MKLAIILITFLARDSSSDGEDDDQGDTPNHASNGCLYLVSWHRGSAAT